jgi:hypothetical protein
MMSAPKACRERLCGKASVAGGRGFCAAHVTSNSLNDARAFARKHDEVSKRYGREPWPSFRQTMIGQNPICQRIMKDGTQCRQPARVVHHLWSPRVRPDLFVDPNNVVCVCANDHPNDEGTPWWRPGVDYVETQFRLPILGGSHVQPFQK